jgi:AmiR/NasT family two-component response regulator
LVELLKLRGASVCIARDGPSAIRCARLIAVSGYSAAGNLAEALAAGFDSYLVKPLTEDALRALVQ